MPAKKSYQSPVPPKPFQRFTAKQPAIAKAYMALGEAVRTAGPLNEREVALVKLAISLGARLEGAAHAHARKAVAAGIQPDALRHVGLLTCPTLGFPQMMAGLGWIEDVIAGKKKR
ncbi:carboxymuconolactone decarboxylase family protein [Candidatus Sumerlaeota bacterium]|nr:carboxymuconolactone decarboxylase family protein [Candidatus Sumerlaeota bacterium]